MTTLQRLQGTSDDIALPVVPYQAPIFFGVTAPELIVSIHFGLSGGVSTQDGRFVIDNLTIGRQYSYYIPLYLHRAAG